MSVDFNTILSDGTAHIIFNDFLGGDSRIPCVSRAWRAAFAETGENFRAQLELRDVECVNATRLESEQVCNGRPPETVLAELMREVGGRVEVGRHRFESPHNTSLELAWSRILVLHHAYSLQDPAARDEAEARRLVNCLHRVSLLIATVQDPRELFGFIETFLAREKLAQRAKSILQQGDLEFRHALYKAQERFNLPGSTKRYFEREARRSGRAAFSQETFLRREGFGVDGDYYQELALRYLWINLRARMRQGAEVNQGPDHEASIHEIRDWINSPANAQALSVFRNLAVNLLSVVPAEIGKLSALRSLRLSQKENVNSRIVSLPDEFGALQNLESLVFNNVTSFSEIPPVLENLPALRELHIGRNGRPIRVFPSWLDNRVNRGMEAWSADEIFVKPARLDALFGLRIFRRLITEEALAEARNEMYAGLPYQEFTNIPFNLWFRETFFIPWTTGYVCASLTEFVYNVWHIGQIYQEGWLELLRSLTVPLIPALIYVGLLLAVGMLPLYSLIWWAGFVTLQAMNAAPLVNLILQNTIGRLAQAIYVAYQEEMGAEDPQMIHVRDLPGPQLP